MILALDTYYQNKKAKTVCIRFHHWTDEHAADIVTEELDNIEEYQPGSFYKRELPCILSILKKTSLENIEAIVIDGYVLLDDAGKHGLGGYLYEALNRKIPVIGVAKTNYTNNTLHQREVYRGNSQRPLFITTLGTPPDTACSYIQSMHGPYRIPTLLKTLDTLTRQ
jgi:deoxyinosine 3'endonuclease (endonuclease V)